MNILYIITLLVLLALFMLIQKSEKNQNAITWFVITTVISLCYNTLVCLIHSFLDIKSTLLNLSITNIIAITIFAVILLKSKKIQKYYVKVFDIAFLAMLLILVIFIAYEQYGFPFNIKYEITDGSTHYYYAEQFSETSELLYKGKNNTPYGIYDSSFRLPTAYVNEGILFKIFDDAILKVDLFILFDLFILYISGIVFYYLLKNCIFNQNKKLEIIAAIFSIMYMCAYQLNSMLYGGVYLSFSLVIIMAFFLLLNKYEKKEISNRVALPLLALLSFGIFFSYAYFITVMYIGLVINIIIRSKANNEKILSEDNLIELLFIVINPLILGITFFIILPSAKGIENEISTLTVEGAIYQNYLTNLLAFIPIVVAGICISIKNEKKQIRFPAIVLILTIIFAIILFIGKELGKVSEYYCFKAYFLIWPLMLYNTYNAICNILNNSNKTLKIGTYVYMTVYILAIIISTLILKTNIGINHIFHHNTEIINKPRNILEYEELKILKRVKTTLDNGEIYLLNPKLNGRMKWAGVLYDKNFIYLDTINGYEITIDQWLEKRDKQYYIAYYADYARTEEKEPNLDENSEKYKILYNDDYGFILERKQKYIPKYY